MIKVLDENNRVYFNNIFPYTRKKIDDKNIKKKKHVVTIGIGGNIGDVQKRFKLLFKMLKSDSRFVIENTSPLLKNPPFGYLNEDDFLNAVIVLGTNLSPISSLNVFQRYEYRFKRTRSFQDAPRTMDIDIIFYDDIKIETKRLIIPHKGYKNRDSVLIPLRYISKLKYGNINRN